MCSNWIFQHMSYRRIAYALRSCYVDPRRAAGLERREFAAEARRIEQPCFLKEGCGPVHAFNERSADARFRG